HLPTATSRVLLAALRRSDDGSACVRRRAAPWAASKTGAEPHPRAPVERGLRLALQRETAGEQLLALRRQQRLGTVPIFGRCLFL
ncbi:hypothetical protein, partial [Xanthomonas graminis]